MPLTPTWGEIADVEAVLIPPDRTDEGDRVSVAAATGVPFSALALRDRVVIMLLFDQVVREDQVELAWQLWQQMNHDGAKEPLWRVLMLFPDLDRELVYAEAARVYGFEEIRISRGRAQQLIQEMERTVEKGLWDAMVDLRVVPVSEVAQKHSHRRRIIFAGSDPTHPDVNVLLTKFRLESFELRYARESEILDLLIEAFPHRYNHLRGLSGITKDFLAAAYPDEDAPGIEEPLIMMSEVEVVRTGASSLALFEDVLVEAVRLHATDICLLPHPNGQTDVFYQVKGALTRRHVIDHIPSATFITAIKSDIIRITGPSEGALEKRLIQRWVDGALVRFRISAVPASEDVHAECVVVRVFA